ADDRRERAGLCHAKDARDPGPVAAVHEVAAAIEAAVEPFHGRVGHAHVEVTLGEGVDDPEVAARRQSEGRTKRRDTSGGKAVEKAVAPERQPAGEIAAAFGKRKQGRGNAGWRETEKRSRNSCAIAVNIRTPPGRPVHGAVWTEHQTLGTYA